MEPENGTSQPDSVEPTPQLPDEQIDRSHLRIDVKEDIEENTGESEPGAGDSMPEPTDMPHNAPLDTPTASPLVDDQAPVSPVVIPEPPKKHSKKKLWVTLAAIMVVLGLVGGAAAYYLLNTKPPQKSQQTTTTPPKQQPVIDAKLQAFQAPTTGEVWDKTPTKLADQHYYATDTVDTTGADYATYYQVGKHGQSTIILSEVAMASEEQITLYEKAPDGTVTIILHPDGNTAYDPSADQTVVGGAAKNIKIDASTHYDSLSPPDSFKLNASEKVLVGNEAAFLGKLTLGQPVDTTIKKTTVAMYGGSKLVKIEHPYVDTKLTSIVYAIDTPVGTEYDLTYKPIPTDLSVYTWSNGTTIPSYPSNSTHSSIISGIVRGCGSAAFSVSRADSAEDSDFVVAGTTKDGQKVYAFKDTKNAIVQKAYSEYADNFKGVAGYTVISFDDFLKNHSIVAYKNADGAWLVYTRDEFAAMGGCAKPVVYLYPTHAEQVSVRIGAHVTVSDPTYDQASGWQVWAQPDGRLTDGGRAYGSLFWEGQGFGQYPSITSGTVVKRADVVATMRTQLAQQGLNQAESSDFVAYWQAKIPNKPYVRLTWFNAVQMNDLAPLYVSPQPDTVLRVFLDMAGYDTKIAMPAQKLTSTPRSGFTLVEWGGLAHTKL